MRILELNKWLAPGGGERFVVDLSNELAKIENNKICVCTYISEKNKKASFYKKELDDVVEYVNLNGKTDFFNQIINVIKVFLFIRRWKPDVVHCHLSAFYMCVIPCLLFKKIKFVNTLHNVAEKNIKPGFEKRIKSFLYKHGMKAVTISPFCYKTFSDYMGFNNTVMINNGCRNIRPTEALKSVHEEVCSYKRSSSTKVFINVARLHPQKNHVLLVEAFEKLILKGYDAILIIIGSYEDRPDIIAKVKSLIYSDRVYLLGNKSNVSDYLLNSDIFCLSSKWEGAPISLLEAAFVGCFPISTPAGGCVDNITSEEWGFLSKDFSVDEYEKMLELCFNAKLPSKEQISFIYKNKYSMKLCAQKYMQVFNNNAKMFEGEENDKK